MARRSKKTSDALIGIVILSGAIGWLIVKLLDTTGTIVPVAVAITVVAGVVWFRHFQRQKRIECLLEKYGDAQIVEWIMGKKFWQGQTSQQLADSLGTPISVDKKAMASRKREVWKYDQWGRNRYALRITLDNDVVIGWDQKSG